MKKICFDIGGSSIKVITFNDKNELILKDEINHTQFKEFELISKKVQCVPLKNCLENIEKYIIKQNEKIKLGISIPGVIDVKNYKVLTPSSICDIDENIFEFFKKQDLIDEIFIENDAKSAAIGELVYGQNNNLVNGVILTLGSGLGGGIIINKKIYKGSHLAAGEFSKIISNINHHGFDISNMSVSSLSTTANCMAYQMMTNSKKEINGIEFMKLVANNDQIAKEILNKWVKSLTNFLVNLNILDPEKILIGGGISSNDIFIKALQKEVENLHPFLKFNLEACKLTNDAACYGMLAIIIGKYKEE